MSVTPSPAEQDVLADTFRRDRYAMSTRQAAGAMAPAALFFVVEGALLVSRPIGSIRILPVAASFLVLLAAAWVRIDLPSGYTVPTQLGFVPLLLFAPAAGVPLLVALAFLIYDLTGVARGQLKPSRLITIPANAAFSLAPAVVFALARVQPSRAGAAVVLVALLAQFAADFVLSAVRQWLDRGASLRSQLSELWVYGVDAGLSCVAFGMAKASEQAPAAVLLTLPLLAILRFFAQERRARLQSLLELRDAYRGTALVLGDVVEADDGYTGKHCKSVVGLTLAVGDKLGLDPDRMRNLEFGALLHDVGKIAIPKEIINKPGKLDPGEWTLIKTHTLEGQKMLDRVGGFMREVGLIVRSHHERWDGAGYPDQLAGEEIPLEARIITCCDSWNAMRTDRSYRKALSFEAAMTEILSGCGSQFDPKIVAVLIAVVTQDERPDLEPSQHLEDASDRNALAALIT